jgi:TRAP-type C4-dicarboxylate transport system substrate-binding protein
MNTVAILIAVVAFGLAVFAFVDRKGLEADLESLKKFIKTMDERAKAEVKVMRQDALKEVSAVRADFHTRVTTLESKYKALEAKLKAAGVEFIDIDKKPFYEATASIRDKYGAPYADLIKRIEAVE